MEGRTCFACGDKGHLKRDCQAFKSRGHGIDNMTSDICFIDTHCHLDLVYERLKYKGTFNDFKAERKFTPNFEGCITSFCEPMTVLCDDFSSEFLSQDDIWGSFGIHPRHCTHYTDDYEWKLIQCMEHPKAIAIGEIGLDYSERCTTPKDLQIHTFKRLLTWAVTLDKPVVIHCREAEEQLIASMLEVLPPEWKIHVHCFTGGIEYARRLMDLFSNIYFGITNLITFPSAKEIHRLAQQLPLNKILIETDAPYFVPIVNKTKSRISLPSDGINVGKEIAKLRDIPLDTVLTKVRENTSAVYSI